MKTLHAVPVALLTLVLAHAASAAQFSSIDPAYQQQIYTAPLTPNQEAGMAWTTAGNLLTRSGSTINEYNLAPTATIHLTSVHTVAVAHPIAGLSTTGYGMTRGLDGFIYTVTGGGLQRFDPANWAAPAQSLAGTAGGAGYGITTLPDGRIAYSDGGGISRVYIYDPTLTTNTLIYTAPTLIDDLEASPTGQLALAFQQTNQVQIITNTGTALANIPSAHHPDGLAFGFNPVGLTPAVYSNNNDGSITRYDMNAGYTSFLGATDIASTIVGFRAYGDLASVGPDCAFYVTAGPNNGINGSTSASIGTNWDDGANTAVTTITRISAGVDRNGLPITDCLFTFATEGIPTPEPTTLLLIVAGAAPLLLRGGRRARKA